ncbi:hypothetical protein C8J57DRAFT_1243458 [Mycena rebaudengoi]|nr:hypothetical protein C8J57DRAFT_1243458 [Mycena rebaudengoi]
MDSEFVYAVQKGDGVLNPPRAKQSVRWEWYHGARTDNFVVLRLALLCTPGDHERNIGQEWAVKPVRNIVKPMKGIGKMADGGSAGGLQKNRRTLPRWEIGPGASKLWHIHPAAESDVRFSAESGPDPGASSAFSLRQEVDEEPQETPAKCLLFLPSSARTRAWRLRDTTLRAERRRWRKRRRAAPVSEEMQGLPSFLTPAPVVPAFIYHGVFFLSPRPAPVLPFFLACSLPLSYPDPSAIPVPVRPFPFPPLPHIPPPQSTFYPAPYFHFSPHTSHTRCFPDSLPFPAHSTTSNLLPQLLYRALVYPSYFPFPPHNHPPLRPFFVDYTFHRPSTYPACSSSTRHSTLFASSSSILLPPLASCALHRISSAPRSPAPIPLPPTHF